MRMAGQVLIVVFLLLNISLAKSDPIHKPDDIPPVDEMPPHGGEGGAGGGGGVPQRPPKPVSNEKWLTLGGKEPLVIARGGASTIFPDSSMVAFDTAIQQGADGIYCDLHMSKDGEGVCSKDIRLNNISNMATIYPEGERTLDVNGQPVTGWFSLDYDIKQLIDGPGLTQGDPNRTAIFDSQLRFFVAGNLAELQTPPSLYWINVPYPGFYMANKQNPEELVLLMAPHVPIDIVSSPEIDFLKSIGGKIDKRTKIIFKFLGADQVEPSTKQPYSGLLKDLAAIKAFAAGILVPKEYILPVNQQKLLEPPTTLVDDAHKAGLEVYAYGFATDKPASYNYSYDPELEYLQFFEKNNFAVDGVLTDSPASAVQATYCLAHDKGIKPPAEKKPLIISHNGASGVYAASSDLAYQRAVDDGADVIDCSVQLSKDGVPFCFASPDLTRDTNAQVNFLGQAILIPELQSKNGIFSFDLTATDIQSLNSLLTTPEETLHLPRHPEHKNMGKIVSLEDFLNFAKAKPVSGILINIENAAYLASKKGLNVVDAVTKALGKITLDKQVYIQSDDTSVLSNFKDAKYKRILNINQDISDVTPQALDEIKKFADSVSLRRPSIITSSNATFLTIASTGLVKKIRAANISVYVSVLRNEFTVIPTDLSADPYTEIATYAKLEAVDGFITEYPSVASAYKRSRCSNLDEPPYTFVAAQPGAIVTVLLVPPPADPPAPTLKPEDVIDPPLPDAQSNVLMSPADKEGSKSGQPANAVNSGQCLLITIILSFLSLYYYH